MASCAYCNTRILFGGKRDGDRRYCNEKCLHQGLLSDAASQLSPARCEGPYLSGSQRQLPQVRRARPSRCAYLLPRVFRRHDDVVVKPAAGGLRTMRHQAKNRRHGLFIVSGLVGPALGNLDDACATHQKSDCLWQNPGPRYAFARAGASAEKPFGSPVPCQSATSGSIARRPARQQVVMASPTAAVESG